MENDPNIDEEAFLANLSLGTDPLTSLAGSVKDPQPNNPLASIIGAIVAIATVAALWYLFA
jgi:hypothetical protein